MRYSILKNKTFVLFLLLLSIGVFFRFYNLNWGAPYYFHPDERNIASSITKITFPQQLNPHFFAYGSLPLYVIYATGVIQNFILNFTQPLENIFLVSFESALIIGRFYSAFLSTLTLILLFKFGKNLGGNVAGIISLSLGVFSVGLIQYSHFATFEIWLTFFIFLLCYFVTLYIKNQRLVFMILSFVILGVLLSIKVSSFVYFPIVICIYLYFEYINVQSSRNKIIKITLSFFRLFSLLCIAIETTLISSPFYLLDFQNFTSSINYESAVAIGTLRVFYTQIFENSIPILYPLIKVYPFILNPIIAIAAFLAIPYIFLKSLKTKNSQLGILFIFLVLTFLTQSFLFVKWTRYYVPTLPYIYLLLAFFLIQKRRFNKIIVSIAIIVSVVYSFSYFKTVLVDTDTRVLSAAWANKNIPSQERIMSEIYDMGIVPFNQNFPGIILFDFYDLDTNPIRDKDLQNTLREIGYIISPSPRLFESRLANPHIYPKGYLFYTGLANESSGFKKVYQTPCDIFCKILYLGHPYGSYEQTANVFDRPHVEIYKKIPD